MSTSNKEYISLNYFISHALFLGLGFSYIGKFAGKDGWICVILGYLLGNIIIWGYDKISKNTNYNLMACLDSKKIIGKVMKIALFFLYTFFILLSSIIFSNFIRVFYFHQTPVWFTLLIPILLCYYGSSKKVIGIGRVALILIPFTFIMYFFDLFCLSNYIQIENYLPILDTKISSILKGTLVFTILSSLPNFLLIDEKIKLKTKLISYFIPFISLLTISLLISGILEEFFILRYNYPEYMILRRIRIFDFIEHVENIASLIWYFHIYIFGSINIVKFNELININKPIKKFIIPSILLINIIAVTILCSRYCDFIRIFFENSFYILFIFLILTCPILYLITKKRKKIPR